MIKDAIKNLSEQFLFEPKIENSDDLRRPGGAVVVGMGGSNLASGLLKVWKPELDLVIHRDFGLPAMTESELQNRLFVVSSYSGQTEETIDAFHKVLEKKFSVIAVAAGGRLLELARENEAPYIQMPDLGPYPRIAAGLSLKAILKAIGEEKGLGEIAKLAGSFDAANYERAGGNLAEKLGAKIPVVYSSVRNLPLAYYWKVNFEETGKTPAFCNVLPELGHNEMMGFVSAARNGSLPRDFCFIFLRDKEDDSRIRKRMDAVKKLYEEKGYGVEAQEPAGESVWQKIFGSLSLSNWTSYYLAQNRGVDPEDMSAIEELKKEMS